MNSRVLLSSIGLLVSACGGGALAAVHVRHPLQVGQVDPNQIPAESVGAESSRGIPNGALVDSAELRSLTPDQICVHVSVWGTQIEPDRVNFGAYQIALLNDQEGVQVGNPQITPEPPSGASYQGWHNRVIPSSSTFVRRVREPMLWQVTTQPALMCFANGGFVTPTTSRMTLELVGGGNHISFQWAFDSSVAGPSPTPTATRGY